MAARVWIFILLIVCASPLHAADADSVAVAAVGDTAVVAEPSAKKPFLKRMNEKFGKLLRSFNEKDTNYIEPQYYHFSAMLQHTIVYQHMSLETQTGYTMSMSPDVLFKAGPYFGYKWLFLGYTVDLKNLMKSTEGTYFDLSLYSNQLGLDLYYINNGSNYKIRKLNLRDYIDTSPLEDQPMKGLSERSYGFNIYYITNHRRYSYPAAFNQCTQQKRNAGSPLVGIGFSRHKFNLDYGVMKDNFIEKLSDSPDVSADDKENFKKSISHLFDREDGLDKVDYRSYTITTGYGYNYVFAHNWLVGASLQAGLSYNVTKTQYDEGLRDIMRNISFNNVSIDTTIRFGVVYNNARWYAGMSSITHTYNYRTEAFKISNIYGTVNIYCGLNFDMYFKHKRI
ncbi:MAG: DUF4421 domain-containing protein [Prevotella sp.]|nr:DUF4421 domain-containing protein [Prevotella sp.]